MHISDEDTEQILPAANVTAFWNMLTSAHNEKPTAWALRVLAHNFGVQEVIARARLAELNLLTYETDLH